MKNFYKKIFSNGIFKSDIEFFTESEFNDLKKIILELKEKHLEKNKLCFCPIGKNENLDKYIEKLCSNINLKNYLKVLNGENFVMRRPLIRFTEKNDKGMRIHQDAIGMTGLLFLINDQPEGSTIVLKGSHLFSSKKNQIADFLSWNSEKLLNFTKYFFSDVKGKAGESFFWIHSLFHGRQPSNSGEKITLFFEFFPNYKDKVLNKNLKLKLDEENKHYIPNLNQLNLPYLKDIMDTNKLDDSILSYSNKIPLCLEVNDNKSNKLKRFLNLIWPTIKISILEIIFWPIYILRVIKSKKN